MALTRLIVVVLLGAALPLLFFFFSRAEAGALGVSYGRVANDLPDPASVVNLLKQNGITMVRIYDANQKVLTSLANTGIKVMVMVPNENVAAVASDQSNALQWVRDNVAAYYPATQIHAVAVGNEVFDMRPDLNSDLVPAMTNVQAALAKLNLADNVKVTTPVAFDALAESWPPSAGRFKDSIAQPVMKPMLDLLQRTGSYLSVNYYPYLTYMAQPNAFTLDYVLANSNPGVVDPDTKLRYYNLLDAQRDATYYAMDKLGFASLAVGHTEHGAPSGGGLHPGHGGRRLLQAGNGGAVASVANAQAYINNLMNRVLAGNRGTPHRPDADMDVYIFALFNENQKGTGADDVEQHFGLFYPNMQKVYEFDFRRPTGGGAPVPPATPSWCVANAGVGDARLQAALDYACGHGADCSAIQPGGSCFLPDTKAAHASYAFNSYYQSMNRAAGACDFNGAASIVYQQPTMCAATASWCVANAGVGDARLQTALDYACGNGADCSAIQPGGACFQPDTKAAHATYAFNDYYQRKGRASVACDFSGAATIVDQQPTMCAATASWCVANAGVGDARLQTALDYACGNGADCSAIQPGGACFQPDTKASHASYAFNSYYQSKHRAAVACDFSGAGSVVYQQPKVGNCVLPSNG
ncbi:glucan endo-1,3-beta-glucosidase 12-like [Panicum miliaceum]|uniref:glucan endo-1,3-beta-D-glucosidase n=1 Tax=Panicum miliaceum TaxID=4540 RepID=A0A3L6QUG9_PANMI|nr:glucan endo-1,3-beta-glucosidase 12-like [Panicum miliaceum]